VRGPRGALPEMGLGRGAPELQAEKRGGLWDGLEVQGAGVKGVHRNA
jgi:hypothetical protein